MRTASRSSKSSTVGRRSTLTPRVCTSVALVVIAMCATACCIVAIAAVWAKRSVVSSSGLERTMFEVSERPIVRRSFSNALTSSATPENGRLELRDLPAIYGAADATVTSRAFSEALVLTVQGAGASPAIGAAVIQVEERTSRLFAAVLRRTRPDLADRMGAPRTPVLDITERGVLHRSLVAASRLAQQRDRAIVGCAVAILIGLLCARSLVRQLRWLGSVLVGTGLGLVLARGIVVRTLSGPVRAPTDRVLLIAVLRGATEPTAVAWIAVTCGAFLLALSGFRVGPKPHTGRDTRQGWAQTGLLRAQTRGPSTGLAFGNRVPTYLRTVGIAAFMAVAAIGFWTHAAKADRTLTCLGTVELCRRPLDQVTLAATHNSMNDRADGFIFPEHESDINAQLESGIRGFLIDTHYGKPSTDGRIWTDLIGIDRAELVRSYGQAAVDAGEQARARLVELHSDRGIYLCHNYCELGATPLRKTLGVIRDFLDTHPTEIVLLDIQDQAAPTDTVHEFDEVGLSGRCTRRPTAPGCQPSARSSTPVPDSSSSPRTNTVQPRGTNAATTGCSPTRPIRRRNSPSSTAAHATGAQRLRRSC